ncbi:hypothetical protein NVP1113A_59 [Vibrio phage 1.113.A._10N.286.51.E7]|nr:hypothetical protein NVP1113A_59 [Vibrio phage 1.113.A._10N.286.51.E7]
MNTLESKLRIAHQIQVAAIKKGFTFSVWACESSFSISVHKGDEIIEYLNEWDITEQELLDWWEAIEK